MLTLYHREGDENLVIKLRRTIAGDCEQSTTPLNYSIQDTSL